MSKNWIKQSDGTWIWKCALCGLYHSGKGDKEHKPVEPF